MDVNAVKRPGGVVAALGQQGRAARGGHACQHGVDVIGGHSIGKLNPREGVQQQATPVHTDVDERGLPVDGCGFGRNGCSHDTAPLFKKGGCHLCQELLDGQQRLHWAAQQRGVVERVHVQWMGRQLRQGELSMVIGRFTEPILTRGLIFEHLYAVPLATLNSYALMLPMPGTAIRQSADNFLQTRGVRPPPARLKRWTSAWRAAADGPATRCVCARSARRPLTWLTAA